MANAKHVQLVKERKLNAYRAEHPDEEIDLNNADFSREDLNGMNFSGADLCDADFSEANLVKAKFIGANLTGASFFVANLAEANFAGAALTDTDLISANLRGVKSLYDAMLFGAKFGSNPGLSPHIVDALASLNKAANEEVMAEAEKKEESP